MTLGRGLLDFPSLVLSQKVCDGLLVGGLSVGVVSFLVALKDRIDVRLLYVFKLVIKVLLFTLMDTVWQVSRGGITD